MVAINSTGYPCLAVIQHFNVAPAAHSHVYGCGRRLLEKWLAGDMNALQQEMGMEDIVILGSDACAQLWENYYNAAREHKWGPFNVH